MASCVCCFHCSTIVVKQYCSSRVFHIAHTAMKLRVPASRNTSNNLWYASDTCTNNASCKSCHEAHARLNTIFSTSAVTFFTSPSPTYPHTRITSHPTPLTTSAVPCRHWLAARDLRPLSTLQKPLSNTPHFDHSPTTIRTRHHALHDHYSRRLRHFLRANSRR